MAPKIINLSDDKFSHRGSRCGVRGSARSDNVLEKGFSYPRSVPWTRKEVHVYAKKFSHRGSRCGVRGSARPANAPEKKFTYQKKSNRLTFVAPAIKC